MDSGIDYILNPTGNGQGKVASSLKFNIATLSLLEEINGIANTQGGFARGIADDTSIISSHQATIDAWDHVALQADSIHITTNTSKSKILLGRQKTKDISLQIIREWNDRGFDNANIIPHPENSQAYYDNDFDTVNELFVSYGLEQTGVPIGSDQYIQSWLTVKIEQLQHMAVSIKLLGHNQLIFCITTFAFSKKLTFLIRNIEPRFITGEILAHFNDIIKDLLCFSASVSVTELPDISFDIARLSINAGGAGLGFLEDTYRQAFVASTITCLPTMIQANPSIKDILDYELSLQSSINNEDLTFTLQDDSNIPSIMKSLFDTVKELQLEGVTYRDKPISLQLLVDLSTTEHKGLQRALCASTKAKRIKDIRQFLSDTDPESLSCHISSATPESGACFRVIPNKKEFKMANKPFAKTLQRLLLIPSPDYKRNTPLICICGQHIDIYGRHLATCSRLAKNGRTRTHDALKLEWYHLLNSANLTVRMEQMPFRAHLNANGQRNFNQLRLDLIFFTNLIGDGDYASHLLDVTVVSPWVHSASHLTPTAANIPLRAANIAAKGKHHKYDDQVKLHNDSSPDCMLTFRPLAIESAGAMSTEMKNLFNIIIKNILCPPESGKKAGLTYAYWSRRMSICLQNNLSLQYVSALDTLRHHYMTSNSSPSDIIPSVNDISSFLLDAYQHDRHYSSPPS